MSKEFFIWKNEKPHGPHTLAQLQEMLQTWQVKPETLVCEKGGKDWVPLGPFLEFAQKSQGKGLMALGALLVVLGVFYAGGSLIKEIDESENGQLGKILRENVESTERELSDPNSELSKVLRDAQSELAISDLTRGFNPNEAARRSSSLRNEVESRQNDFLSLHRQRLAAYERERANGRVLHFGIASALIVGGIAMRVAARKKSSVAPVTAPPPPTAQNSPARQNTPPPPKPPSRPAAPQMMLKDECPSCAQHVEYPSEISGQAVPCPSCQATITLA